MKNNILKTIIFALGVLSLSSCETDLDTINENPNAPTNIDPQYLLTYISKSTFEVEEPSMYASRMLIKTDGEDVYQYMKWNEASFKKTYNTNLLNAGKMMEEAEKINHKNYQAIGKFFRAFHFYTLSLKLGSIPYSDAVKGESGITQSKYDSQEQVMIGILNELKEANDLMNSSDAIAGDIIYHGDASKWKKLINSFRLKVLISLSKKTTIGELNIANEFAYIAGNQPLMTSIQDNGELKFANAQDSRYTTFNSSSYGSSLYMADYFINLFKERQDPRVFTFAEQTTSAKENGLAITNFNGYNGGDPTAPYSENAALIEAKNISKANERFYKDPTNEPSNILSYPELEFILAEATARGWISGLAKTHYDQAIKASFQFYQTYVKNSNQYFAGFNVDQYLASSPVVYNATASLEAQLEKIITQKYMTMFHQAQWTSYQDYLRTGYPNLPLQEGVTAPLRFRYPQEEYNYNTTNLQSALISQYGGQDNIHSKPWWLQ